ncbi:dipeptidase [Corynebacterium felinum]|uniref:Acetylornithine deacetylase/succinyl-diaminopimelate desuccinylase-like protein n=1 Tax=Corynebacterium felinum TaxID=131318 RepID=A0ABU2B5J1_9CORY|nr:dipeptidase [Corynebacterium felinum]MDF5820125.1 dipeptidase [Corynebacterium felinum]MDR7353875.1 acetylornithine deacetylase/succinyl-diaminopimelate desuccinylase-like protein [Corynebacterium felinum]WJY96049.1 putative succinyl-diaminopimelate desuccinylase [Corynebacterium felinum]
MSIHETSAALRPLIEGQRERIFADLSALTSFNSVHSVPELADAHTGAAEWIRTALSSVGLDVTAYKEETGSPTFIGTEAAVGNAPTVLLYCHYDVVPAGNREDWISDPFTLTERDGRWYARGAADCKGNAVMHLAALRAVNELGGTDLGLKVLVEGSEEQGGAELSALIAEQPELFSADVILIADSGNTAVGEPTLTTTLRGGAQIDLRVDTLETPVHSGSFGGAAPDATAALIRLIDSFRDQTGRTVIDGVDCTRKWDGAGYDPDTFRADAGILDGVAIMGDDHDDPADMVWARPAISVTGFSSTPVEQAVNAVPATASARLNLRVPPGMDAAEVAEAVVAHAHAHAPWGVKVQAEAFDINQPFSGSIDGPAVEVFSRCLRAAYDDKELMVVGAGGSIPLCTELMEINPHAELTLFGVEEPKCTIHSPNESVDPDEIRDIAIAEATFLLNYGK